MSIKINLDSPRPIYSGTLLHGTVNCAFESRQTIRSIKIRCYGKEHTEWRTGGKHKRTFRGTHFFYQMETTLFEPENGEIPAGRYTYPFNFLLPANIPSAFEFEYGYIRHNLKAIVDIPLAIDPRDRLDLEPISVLDINSLPVVPINLKEPFQAKDQTMMGCCWFYDTDPIKMEVQINKLAFIVGETIRINIEILNMSSANVEDVTVKLTRCFVAHSEEPRHDTRFVNEDLLEKKLSGVGAHGQQTYDVDLFIPLELGVPNMTACQLLEGIYRLDVTGKTSGMNRDLNMVIAEIKIGHVDSANQMNQYAPPVQQSSGNAGYPGYPYPSAPGEENGPSAPALGFGEIKGNPYAPPPSYDDITSKRPLL